MGDLQETREAVVGREEKGGRQWQLRFSLFFSPKAEGKDKFDHTGENGQFGLDFL